MNRAGMPNTHVEVACCDDCPFDVLAFCTLVPPDTLGDAIHWDGDPEYERIPKWCPLRNGPLTRVIRLKVKP